MSQAKLCSKTLPFLSPTTVGEILILLSSNHLHCVNFVKKSALFCLLINYPPCSLDLRMKFENSGYAIVVQGSEELDRNAALFNLKQFSNELCPREKERELTGFLIFSKNFSCCL